jgi:hypothetical protein
MQTLPVVSRAIDSVRNLGIGAIITITLIVLGVLLFNGVFFYAEPGFQYHVRTITGSEKVEPISKSPAGRARSPEGAQARRRAWPC